MIRTGLFATIVIAGLAWQSNGALAQAPVSEEARAQFNAGVAFLTGRGVARDPAEAARRFGRYGDGADGERQAKVGLAYMGYGAIGPVVPDYAAAAAWFRRAAAQGSYRAARELGDMYEYGLGVPADPIVASDWYRRASANAGGKDGHMLALRALLGLEGGVDFRAAAAGFLAARERDNPLVAFALGVMHEHGLGVARDYGEAARWYTVAAEPSGGAPSMPWVADARGGEALYRLGSLHERGLGVARDRGAALALYRRAAQRGEVRAQVALAEAYERGKGVDADAWEAAQWYRAAAGQGSALTQARLGALLPGDEGAMWRRLAATHRWAPDPARRFDQGSEAAEALAEVQLVAARECLGAERYRDGLRLLRALAERGQANMLFDLALALDTAPATSSQGRVRDGAEAAIWYARAAEQGHAGASLALAGKYAAGFDVPRDAARAAQWSRRAAELGADDRARRDQVVLARDGRIARDGDRRRDAGELLLEN